MIDGRVADEVSKNEAGRVEHHHAPPPLLITISASRTSSVFTSHRARPHCTATSVSNNKRQLGLIGPALGDLLQRDLWCAASYCISGLANGLKPIVGIAGANYRNAACRSEWQARFGPWKVCLAYLVSELG